MTPLARPGMTLAETLVGLVLLGLVAALGLSALGLVGRAAASAGADPGAVGAAQDLLRLRLSAALPSLGEGRRGQAALLFEGGPERLTFPAELPPRFGLPSPALLELRRAEGALRLFWRPLSAAPATAQGGEGAAGRVLLDDVAALRLRYFGAPRPSEPVAWRESWSDAALLPTLVELTVEFRDDPPGAARQWPPLVVAPRFARPASTAPADAAPSAPRNGGSSR